MNANHKSRFENKSVPKAVFSNVIPSIVSMIMVLLYNLADTFFIGQTKNPLMVAAVSLATPAFLIFMAVGLMFGIGGTSLISRRLGEGKKEDAKHTSSFCCWTGIIIGIIAAVLMIIFVKPVSYLVGASEATLEYTKEYLGIVSLSIPFLIFSNIYSNVIRAEGYPTTAMIGMVVGNITNIILDPILILGFKMNVAGAALATVVGNVLASVVYLVHLLSKKTLLSINIKDYRIKSGIATGVLAIGFPASLNNILMSISNILLNNLMQDFGDMAVAGLGVAMKVNMIVVMLLIGLGTGVQPLLGYCYGTRNRKRFVEVMKFSLLCAIILSAIMTVICYVWAETFVRLFLDNDDAFALGMTFSRIYILSGPILGILFVLINAIQATGASIPALILSFSRQGLVFIPVLFTLYYVGNTAKAISFAQPITDYIAVLLAIILFLITYNKYIKKIDISNEIKRLEEAI